MSGFLKPTIESRQPKSQASPLAENVLSLLRQTFGGEGFGEGIGAGQKAATEGVGDFISARKDIGAFEELMGPLRKMFNTQTDRSVGEMKEGLGAVGGRMGSSALKIEGKMRGEQDTSLDAMISQLFLQDQGRLLQALGLQHGMGTQNIQPFFDFGALGILPEQTIVGDSPAAGIAGLLQGLAAIAGPAKGAG